MILLHIFSTDIDVLSTPWIRILIKSLIM